MVVVLTLVLLFHLVKTARARDGGGCSNTGPGLTFVLTLVLLFHLVKTARDRD